MLNKRDPSKGSQPALLPLHGIQDKKPRYLDRDSIIVGRAKGCDIGLDAPDISNLHCVISRTQEGYRIRDCGSRSGTKVNGECVKSTTLLQDGDVLQLGLFSFTVQVPPVRPGQTIETAKIERLQKSRQRLAQRGLKLRRKLRNMNDLGVTRTPSELNIKASQIKSQIRSYDQRFAEMEESERELEKERDRPTAIFANAGRNFSSAASRRRLA
jgi:pSer/pThr/pTyr-binding forkhead associated (FHA) protein